MKQEITREEFIKMYNEMLNDCTEEIKIGYLTFEASDVLEKLDPTAYRCGLNDYYNSITDEYFCEEME